MGRATRAVIIVGLAVFVTLALIPWTGFFAVFAVLATPMCATIVTAIELFYRRLYWEGISLISAVALILVAVLLHKT